MPDSNPTNMEVKQPRMLSRDEIARNGAVEIISLSGIVSWNSENVEDVLAHTLLAADTARREENETLLAENGMLKEALERMEKALLKGAHNFDEVARFLDGIDEQEIANICRLSSDANRKLVQSALSLREAK